MHEKTHLTAAWRIACGATATVSVTAAPGEEHPCSVGGDVVCSGYRGPAGL